MEIAEDRRRDRSARAQRTAIYGVAYQATYALIQLACLALLVRHTSKDVFGLWMTILALTTWAPMANVGQPAALMSKLGAVALTDKVAAERIFSSSMVMVLGVAVLLAVSLIVTTPLVSWATILNADTRATIDVAQATAVLAMGIAILSVPATMSGYAIFAHQRGDFVHRTMIAGNVLGFVAFGLAVWVNQPIQVTGALMISGPLLGGLALWLMSGSGDLIPMPRWQAVDVKTFRMMLGAGLYFVAIDTANLALVRTPEVIVAHVNGTEAVGLFSSIGRLPLLMLAVFQAILLPYWPALGEAVHRGDHVWVRQVVTKSLRTLLVVCAVGVLGMGMFGGPFVRVWLGSDDATIPHLIGAACVQSLAMAMLTWLSVMFGALSLFRQQVTIFALTAALYFPLAMTLGRHLGPVGVALAQAGTVLLFAAPMGTWILYRRLNPAMIRQAS